MRIVVVSDTHNMHERIDLPDGDVLVRCGGCLGHLERGEPLRKVWAEIPEDTDVLITHGPPHGMLDRTTRGERVGCEELIERVDVVKPKLHLFGHIHEGYGTERKGETLFVNASTCDARYRPVNAPVVLTI